MWISTFKHHRPTLICATCLLLLAAISACKREPEVPPESYRVRAQVRQVPALDDPRGEIVVRHEAIPSFKNEEGEIVGMDTMSMPFPLADPALVAGLAPGDRIVMDIEVSWHGGNPLEVTAIDKLPEGTRLDFEAGAEDEAPEAEATEPAMHHAETAEPEAGEDSPSQ